MRWSILQAKKYQHYCQYFRDCYPELPAELIERCAAEIVERLKDSPP